MEDPAVFTRAWKFSMPLYRRLEPKAQLLEYRCIGVCRGVHCGHLRKEPLVRHWESETFVVDVTRKVPQGDKLHE